MGQVISLPIDEIDEYLSSYRPYSGTIVAEMASDTSNQMWEPIKHLEKLTNASTKGEKDTELTGELDS